MCYLNNFLIVILAKEKSWLFNLLCKMSIVAFTKVLCLERLNQRLVCEILNKVHQPVTCE